MSDSAIPISPARFRAALADLPLSSLHEKAAEIRNSQMHLRASNAQLKEYADAGDRDCAEAIAENEVVLARMEERVGLLREEVEGRGMLWAEQSAASAKGDDVNGDAVNGTAASRENETVDQPAARSQESAQTRSGRYTDEELAQRLAAQMEDESDGVHL